MPDPEITDTSPTPLQLATINDLMNELLSRCDAAMCVMRFTADANNTSVQMYQRGDMFTMVGLADYACHLTRLRVQGTITRVTFEENDDPLK